jgi:hypothetical protein
MGKKEFQGELMVWRTKVQARVQGYSFLQLLFFFLFFKPLFKFHEMEKMLWIENIIESTQAPLFGLILKLTWLVL